MKYKSDFSKINFFIPLFPALIISLIAIFSGDPIEMVLAPIGILILFLSVLISVTFFTTYYEIQENLLVISMFFYITKVLKLCITNTTTFLYRQTIETNLLSS
jgi:uncharacterized membrane protein YoaT (DUF817 family)